MVLELDSELEWESGKMVKDRNEDVRGGITATMLDPTSSRMERTGEEHRRTSEGTAIMNSKSICFWNLPAWGSSYVNAESGSEEKTMMKKALGGSDELCRGGDVDQ
jgi:hypothetical protein